MKIIRLFPIILGMALALNARAADVSAPTNRTEVVFDHPENFTDVKDSSLPSDKGRDAILDQFRGFLVQRTAPLLPEGDTLKITFTDIDLAGEYEPWHGPNLSDVRIVKDIYPPDLKFTYVVSDGAGRVVKQGSENLRDMNFQMRLMADRSDPLRYEKDMLNDWVRSTLRDLK